MYDSRGIISMMSNDIIEMQGLSKQDPQFIDGIFLNLDPAVELSALSLQEGSHSDCKERYRIWV